MSEYEQKLNSLLFWTPGILISIVVLLIFSFISAPDTMIESLENIKTILTLGMVINVIVSLILTMIFGLIRYFITKRSYKDFWKEFIFLLIVVGACSIVAVFLNNNIESLKPFEMIYETRKLWIPLLITLVLMLVTTILIVIRNHSNKQKGVPSTSTLKIVGSMFLIYLLISAYVCVIFNQAYWVVTLYK